MVVMWPRGCTRSYRGHSVVSPSDVFASRSRGGQLQKLIHRPTQKKEKVSLDGPRQHVCHVRDAVDEYSVPVREITSLEKSDGTCDRGGLRADRDLPGAVNKCASCTDQMQAPCWCAPRWLAKTCGDLTERRFRLGGGKHHRVPRQSGRIPRLSNGSGPVARCWHFLRPALCPCCHANNRDIARLPPRGLPLHSSGCQGYPQDSPPAGGESHSGRMRRDGCGKWRQESPIIAFKKLIDQ